MPPGSHGPEDVVIEIVNIGPGRQFRARLEDGLWVWEAPADLPAPTQGKSLEVIVKLFRNELPTPITKIAYYRVDGIVNYTVQVRVRPADVPHGW